jgi:hypothetical protein
MKPSLPVLKPTSYSHNLALVEIPSQRWAGRNIDIVDFLRGTWMVYMVCRCNESISSCLEIHKLGKASDKVSWVAILLEYPLFFVFGLAQC